MLERRLERRADEVELRPVVDRATLLALQPAMEDGARRPERRPLHRRRSSRRPAQARAPPSASSPRGSLALLKLSRCRAALAGRDFVTPDDVKAVAVPGARATG